MEQGFVAVNHFVDGIVVGRYGSSASARRKNLEPEDDSHMSQRHGVAWEPDSLTG